MALPAIPESAPSYLQALIAAHPELAALNQDAFAGSSKPMPPSIVADKGRFIIKKDGQETVVSFPDNAANQAAGIVGMPVPQLQAIILRAKPGVEKAWYSTKYTPGQETQSPDCSSEDGVKPDPSSRIKQCDNCATCSQNAFGSGTNADGSLSDGKACADRKVVAVYAAGSVYRFAVPPASLSGKRASGAGMAWNPYCTDLNRKGLPIASVITGISFEQGDKSYQLNFNFGGMLAEKQLTAIIPMLQAPEVLEIINPRNPAAAQGQIASTTTQAIEHKESNVVDMAAVKAQNEANAAAEKAAADVKAKADKAAAAKKAKDDKEAAAKAAAAASAGQDDVLGLSDLAPAAAQETSGPTDAELLDSLGL